MGGAYSSRFRIRGRRNIVIALSAIRIISTRIHVFLGGGGARMASKEIRGMKAEKSLRVELYSTAKKKSARREWLSTPQKMAGLKI